MAEMANTLAFAAYNHQSTLYTEDQNSAPIDHDGTKHDVNPRDRDSGVFLSDTEDSVASLTPSRPTSIPLKHTPSTTSTPTLTRAESTRTERLRRPAELNLSRSLTEHPSKPKSELELRYDMVRNSQTQSRASLKSPTQLLQDRLNLSPKKQSHETVRVFTPPRPMLNGCILPGPVAQMEAFTGKDVRARTENGRPAWWCKFDKLVVFDGMEESEVGESTIKTRTSKGLTIARRRGDTETVLIPLDCMHCQEMLNRREWKYDVQVCKRSVCWDCKERCRWEMDQETKMEENLSAEETGEVGRGRADSVLQSQQAEEEELMRKAGIEMVPKSPVEAVGGIEERLGDN